MIRIALCDDEKKILDELSEHIKNYSKKRNIQDVEVFCFSSARSVISALEDGMLFNIFVIDVYIGDEMGTELARDIRKKGIENPIIFATTSIEHAPQSFETGTLRYLIKPINPLKFYEAMDVAFVQADKISERLIKLKTENGIERINANHILYSESHAHYQHITFENGNKTKVRMTVSELYSILIKSDGFIRVGSAYIINLRNVKNVTTSEVLLYKNINIPIPRGKHIEIKKAFWNFQYEGQECEIKK